MNYSNDPQYVMLNFWVPPDIRWLFDAIMVAFIVLFFVGIHYRMHMAQHLVPPPYCFWLRRVLKKIGDKGLI